MENDTLHAAVAAGDDVARVRALVAAGADMEERHVVDQYAECTPLHHAAVKGRVAVARHLVECGADKEATCTTAVAMVHARQTPLHAAAENGRIDVVRMLVEHGANMKAVDIGKWTPFSHACRVGHVAVAQYLLEQGCDVDHTDMLGLTSLHAAALGGLWYVSGSDA